jgi:hypothetical protein
VTYDTGLAVTVTDLRRFTPSGTAVGMTPGTVGVIATIDVDNGSPADLDTSLFTVAVATGETIAPRVFDAAQDLGSGITGSVSAGGQTSGNYAFAVSEEGLDRIEVRITPDLTQPETAVFVRTAS